MPSNRAQRRVANRAIGVRMNQTPTAESRACWLCTYVASTILGASLRDWKDHEGKPIEFRIGDRLEAPNGLRLQNGKWLPLCAPCCKHVYTLLGLSENAHMLEHHPALAQLVPQNQQPGRSIGGIILPS